jgi:hypothetical protein
VSKPPRADALRTSLITAVKTDQSGTKNARVAHHSRQNVYLRVTFRPRTLPLTGANEGAVMPSIVLDDDGQLDRSRWALASPCARKVEQALDECTSFGRGRPPLEDDEDVEIAGRAQATEHGRAVQVDAEHVSLVPIENDVKYLGPKR